MVSPSSNPFYGSSAGATPINSGYQRLALDNLIRRELKVSDPNDPQQIANALLERFKDDPRAKAINQEAKGLPFLLSMPSNGMPALQAPTSCAAELKQASDDVNRDLEELTSNSLLKNVTPEIRGWAQAVRSAIQEGTAAARFALDPRQRDKAFAIRRQLGDYARMARLVGALTPSANMAYRKFAQSLDEVASVLLVMMGEALSNVGFNGGRFLLQAPYSELQARRDAVIYALRNLTGATQQAYGPNDWPRGLDAYRVLFRILEDQGQGDLRALLIEHELSRTMDELIQRAAHGSADGLRALGSTAQLDLERFRRLVAIGDRAVVPPSPPLTAFLEALQLFADAFEGSGGFRLLRVARPPILFYGLYGTRTMDDSDRILLDLIIRRGQLADQLDCYLGCGCGADGVKCQAILDKILYDIDRAIDLYAMGKDYLGQPELRAAAYGYVIDYFLNKFSLDPPPAGRRACSLPSDLASPINNPSSGILVDLQNLLRPTIDYADSEWAVMIDALVSSGPVKGVAQDVQTELSSACPPIDANLAMNIGTAIAALGLNSIYKLKDLTTLYTLTKQGLAKLEANGIDTDSMTSRPHFIQLGELLHLLHQELCIQKDMELRWESLVKSLAPDCLGIDNVLNAIKAVINGAIDQVSGTTFCLPFDPKIPPHFESSLGEIHDTIVP